MRKLLIASLCVSTLFAAKQESVEEVVKSETAFTFSLYNALPQTADNVVVSPYSIFTALGMTSLGARADTLAEMNRCLFIGMKPPLFAKTSSLLMTTLTPSGKNGQTYELTLANHLWVKKGSYVLADFRNIIENSFQAQLSLLDFAAPSALKTINDSISEKTHGTIPHLLDDLDPQTAMVITNAVYFKGMWEHPFNPQRTKSAPFHISDEESRDVKMMEQTSSFPYTENESFQALALPFIGKSERGAHIACLILLPKGNDLDKLEIDASSFKETLAALKSTPVHARIPSFTFSYKVELNALLQKMGMKKAFTPEANFSGIDGMKTLALSQVAHAAFFALDEMGVTATGATAAVLRPTAVGPQVETVDFLADHPFLFFLVDLHTQTPLFVGKFCK
jgi:serine protease inhibitor